MRDLSPLVSTDKIDKEKLLDDFVVMCSFLGNDFLPGKRSTELSCLAYCQDKTKVFESVPAMQYSGQRKGHDFKHYCDVKHGRALM